MPKLDTAQRLGIPVHAPERAHVPSQTLAHSPQYSRSDLFDRGRYRQDMRDRVLHAEAFLCALVLGAFADFAQRPLHCGDESRQSGLQNIIGGADFECLDRLFFDVPETKMKGRSGRALTTNFNAERPSNEGSA